MTVLRARNDAEPPDGLAPIKPGEADKDFVADEVVVRFGSGRWRVFDPDQRDFRDLLQLLEEDRRELTPPQTNELYLRCIEGSGIVDGLGLQYADLEASRSEGPMNRHQAAEDWKVPHFHEPARFHHAHDTLSSGVSAQRGRNISVCIGIAMQGPSEDAPAIVTVVK